MAERPIRVMVMHTSPIVRVGAAAMLQRTDDINLIGTTDESPRSRQRCTDLDIDVLVTSPAALQHGQETTGRWIDELTNTRVVVLSDTVDEALVHAVSASSVDACLELSTLNDHELAAAVRAVMHGQATFSSEFLPDLVQHRSQQSSLTPLTARENDILELLARGNTNEVIATTLGLTEGTVRNYVSGILTKLGTPNRTAAAVLAIQDGLVDLAHRHHAEAT